MDKLCKRCQFRTPQTRAICQVCGHTEFVKLDSSFNIIDENKSQHASATSSASDDGSLTFTTQAFLETVRRDASSMLQEFSSKVQSAATKIYMLAVTPSSKSAEPFDTAKMLSQHRAASVDNNIPAKTVQEINKPISTGNVLKPAILIPIETTIPADAAPSADPEVQKARLDELMSWFKAYGTTSSLIIESGAVQSSEPEMEELQQAA